MRRKHGFAEKACQARRTKVAGYLPDSLSAGRSPRGQGKPAPKRGNRRDLAAEEDDKDGDTFIDRQYA